MVTAFAPGRFAMASETAGTREKPVSARSSWNTRASVASEVRVTSATSRT